MDNTTIIEGVKEFLDRAFAKFVQADLSAVTEFYTPDSVLAIGKDVIVGRDNLKAFYEGFFAAYQIVENYPISLNYQITLPTVVSVTAHEKMVLSPKVEGLTAVDMELMVTFVLKKVDGAWICCYEQASSFGDLF